MLMQQQAEASRRRENFRAAVATASSSSPSSANDDSGDFSYGTRHLFIELAQPLPLTLEQAILIGSLDSLRCACCPQGLKRLCAVTPFVFLAIWSGTISSATWDEEGCGDIHDWLLPTVALLLSWPLVAWPLVFCTNDYGHAAREVARRKPPSQDASPADDPADSSSRIMSGARIRLCVVLLLSAGNIISGGIGQRIIAAAVEASSKEVAAATPLGGGGGNQTIAGAPSNDDHGCAKDGGFTYCASRDECIREWEISCNDTAIEPAGNFTHFPGSTAAVLCDSEPLIATAHSVAGTAIFV
jgi:hypothetical protein